MVEGNIPNTTSYMELFIATMEMKNNVFDGYQYEIQKSRVEDGKYYIQVKYIVWSCS